MAIIALVAALCVFLGRRQQENERAAMLAPYRNVYLPNITVEGVSVSGMTRGAAEEAVIHAVSARQNSWSLDLNWQGHTFTTLNYALMGINTDLDQVHGLLDQAYAYGHRGTDDEKLTALYQLSEIPLELSTAQSELSDANLTTILSQIGAYFERPATDARLIAFDPTAKDPFVIEPEVTGTTLDIDRARQEIMHLAATGQGGAYEFTPDPVPPQVTAEDLRGQVRLLSSGTTKIATTSPEGRNANIKIATEKINGTMLRPGETFSFNRIVGNRTEENGFVAAIEYLYGNEVPGIGGGVCQVSTTVYLAAVTANLDITERSPHSLKVSYTELGQDATVYWPRLDLAFKNNTASNIYIIARYENQPKTTKRWQCTVEIYGTPADPNVKYVLRSEVDDVLLPGEPILRKDEKGTYVEFEDETYKLQSGHEGYVITTYLDRVENGQVTQSRKLHTDTYKSAADVYYVGVKNRDELYFN